jgi:hypothetical protein
LPSNNLIFVGSVKSRSNNNGGEDIQLGFNREHIDLMLKHLNEKGWVNINIKEGRQGKYMIIKNAESIDNIGHE